MKQVSIIGLGYIGLPTAILAAKSGYKVFGFDIDNKKVEKLRIGQSTILEKGIEKKLSEVINKNLQVFNYIKPSDCFVISVPTPVKKDQPDFKDNSNWQEEFELD